MSKPPRHFLDISALPLEELRNMLALSVAMKAKLKAREKQAESTKKPLEGKTLAMIFERPSTRTRVSFDVGMRQLGGEAIMLTGAEMQLGRGETIADTARVLSRYVDAIMIRILNHEALLELAAHATVPVINGLTRRSHPCQVMADLMTFEAHRGPIEGRTVAWTGDDNNVLASWAHAAERFKFKLNVATPPQLAPNRAMKEWIKATQAPIVGRPATTRPVCIIHRACSWLRCRVNIDRMIVMTRRRLLEALRASQDKGTVPPGVDDPDIGGRARSGDLIAPESQPWLEAYEQTLAQALHPVMALAAE